MGLPARFTSHESKDWRGRLRQYHTNLHTKTCRLISERPPAGRAKESPTPLSQVFTGFRMDAGRHSPAEEAAAADVALTLRQPAGRKCNCQQQPAAG